MREEAKLKQLNCCAFLESFKRGKVPFLSKSNAKVSDIYIYSKLGCLQKYWTSYDFCLEMFYTDSQAEWKIRFPFYMRLTSQCTYLFCFDFKQMNKRHYMKKNLQWYYATRITSLCSTLEIQQLRFFHKLKKTQFKRNHFT